jgi:pimeloyl-ACP methyl ester carboxylesterase
MRGGRVRLAAASALALAALTVATEPARADVLGDCSPGAPDRARCGAVTVPLDRAGRVPGTVRLRVRELPARGGTATGTILALAGGPGQAAVPLLEHFAAALAPALRSRRLVTFDQRGTGGSGRIACPSLGRALELSAAVARCASDLGPARVAYTTAASVADVEAVRAALGIERMTIFGVSYGTKVALAYAAAHPERVERLVLDSVVAPEGVDPFERTTLASVPRVLRTLCGRACRFTRDPVADVAGLVRRLARKALHGSALDASGRPRPVSLTRAGLLALLLAGDFDRHLRAAFPAAVRAALAGDGAPLLRLAAGTGPSALPITADSDAVYVATTCADGGVPWPPGTPPAQRRAAVNAAAAALPPSAFAPFDRATVRSLGTADLCRGWPESPIVQPLPPLPATPALLLGGEDDLRTPLADAAALARRLPGARMLAVPDAGHGVLFGDLTDCAEAAVLAFLDGRDPARCRAHRRAAPALPLPPRRLAALARVRGLPPRLGRTVRAVLRTLDDASEQIVARVEAGGDPTGFGGLRSGSAALGRRGLRLRGYGYVPGVAVSGLIPARGRSFTLRVGGAAGVRGRLTFSAKGVAGRLDGAPVDVGPRALGWSAASARAAAAAASTI